MKRAIPLLAAVLALGGCATYVGGPDAYDGAGYYGYPAYSPAYPGYPAYPAYSGYAAPGYAWPGYYPEVGAVYLNRGPVVRPAVPPPPHWHHRPPTATLGGAPHPGHWQPGPGTARPARPAAVPGAQPAQRPHPPGNRPPGGWRRTPPQPG